MAGGSVLHHRSLRSGLSLEKATLGDGDAEDNFCVGLLGLELLMLESTTVFSRQLVAEAPCGMLDTEGTIALAMSGEGHHPRQHQVTGMGMSPGFLDSARRFSCADSSTAGWEEGNARFETGKPRCEPIACSLQQEHAASIPLLSLFLRIGRPG